MDAERLLREAQRREITAASRLAEMQQLDRITRAIREWRNPDVVRPIAAPLLRLTSSSPSGLGLKSRHGRYLARVTDVNGRRKGSATSTKESMHGDPLTVGKQLNRHGDARDHYIAWMNVGVSVSKLGWPQTTIARRHTRELLNRPELTPRKTE